MATTIQDVEKAAADLGAAIQTFDSKDTTAKSDQTTADAAQGVATASAAGAAAAKQGMLDAHAAFDAVLQAFLGAAAHP